MSDQSSQSANPQNQPAPLPELTTSLSTSPEERPRILKLVADSIAQQRQAAAKALIFHPLSIFLLGIVLALQAQYLNIATLLTTFGGTVMVFLVAIRGYTSGYIHAAENVRLWDWLISDAPPSSTKTAADISSIAASSSGSPSSPSSKRTRKNSNDTTVSQVYVTQWGDEIIGALVLRVSKRDRTAYVRSWTVKNKYRGKGVGKVLLEEGVRGVMLGESSATDGIAIGKIKDVILQDTHTGSLRVLPDVTVGGLLPLSLNSVFERREEKTRRSIDDAVRAVIAGQKSKR